MNEYNRKFEKLKNKEIVWFVYNITIFYDLFFLKTFIVRHLESPPLYICIYILLMTLKFILKFRLKYKWFWIKIINQTFLKYIFF